MNKITLDSRYKKFGFAILVTAIFMIVLPILCFFLLISRPNDNLYEAKSIRGTNFKIYQENAYVAITGSGYYLVVDADPNSLTEIGLGNTASQLAKDKNHVFCGNKIIPMLNPNAITASFGGYIADNNYAYYCDYAKPNPNLSFFESLIGLHKTAFDKDKPQKHYNELIQLASDSPANLRSITMNYAKDNDLVYYKGKKIDGADPKSITTVIESSTGDSKRVSLRYVQDKNHIYYQGEVLPYASPESTKIYYFTQYGLDYAYDQQIDQFYIGSTPFPRFVALDISTDNSKKYEVASYLKKGQLPPSQYNTAHLQFLNITNKHSYHILFFNEQGIFYWNNHQQQKLIAACSVPFNTQEMQILSDEFFADNNNSYFLQAKERWEKGRYGYYLVFQQTLMFQINNIGVTDWQKFAIVKNQKSGTIGTLWKADEQYYFEPNLDKDHSFPSALYKMQNIESLIQDQLLSVNNDELAILNLGNSELHDYITQIEGEPVCLAITHFR